MKLVLNCLLLVALAGGSAVQGAGLETQPWPRQTQCKTCVSVQFGRLAMRLPLGSLHKILVINSEDSALHILLAPPPAKKSVVFLASSFDSWLSSAPADSTPAQERLSHEQLFDAIGSRSARGRIAAIRRNAGIETASRYIKRSRGGVHAYWVQSGLPLGSQTVYFVIDGDATLYSLNGDITQRFFDIVLANLQAVDVP